MRHKLKNYDTGVAKSDQLFRVDVSNCAVLSVLSYTVTHTHFEGGGVVPSGFRNECKVVHHEATLICFWRCTKVVSRIYYILFYAMKCNLSLAEYSG